jgi:hypothetical protein
MESGNIHRPTNKYIGQTDTQTYRQIQRTTDRYSEIRTNTQDYRQIHRPTDRYTELQTDIQIHRQIHR